MRRRLFSWIVPLVATAWVARNVFRSESPPPESADVICIGDSLTAGFVSTSRDHRARSVSFHPYATALEAALGPGTRVLPFGFSGLTSQQLIDYSDRTKTVMTEITKGKVLSSTQRPGIALAIRMHRPKLAVIMAGTNDVLRLENTTGVDIADRVWTLHKIAHRERVRTIALGIPDWSPGREKANRSKRLFDVRDELNKRLESYAHKSSHLATYIEFPFPFKQDSQWWSLDGLHLTPVGYKELGLRLAEHVTPLLQDPLPDAPVAVKEAKH